MTPMTEALTKTVALAGNVPLKLRGRLRATNGFTIAGFVPLVVDDPSKGTLSV
jgi:hypothetical protein